LVLLDRQTGLVTADCGRYHCCSVWHEQAHLAAALCPYASAFLKVRSLSKTSAPLAALVEALPLAYGAGTRWVCFAADLGYFDPIPKLRERFKVTLNLRPVRAALRLLTAMVLEGRVKRSPSTTLSLDQNADEAFQSGSGSSTASARLAQRDQDRIGRLRDPTESGGSYGSPPISVHLRGYTWRSPLRAGPAACRKSTGIVHRTQCNWQSGGDALSRDSRCERMPMTCMAASEMPGEPDETTTTRPVGIARKSAHRDYLHRAAWTPRSSISMPCTAPEPGAVSRDDKVYTACIRAWNDFVAEGTRRSRQVASCRWASFPRPISRILPSDGDGALPTDRTQRVRSTSSRAGRDSDHQGRYVPGAEAIKTRALPVTVPSIWPFVHGRDGSCFGQFPNVWRPRGSRPAGESSRAPVALTSSS